MWSTAVVSVFQIQIESTCKLITETAGYMQQRCSVYYNLTVWKQVLDAAMSELRLV